MVDGHDVFQRVFEPLEGVDLMFPADGEEGIDHGCPLRRFVASGEQVIFPAKGIINVSLIQSIFSSRLRT